MKIADVRYGSRDVELVANVKELGEIREVKTKYGRTVVMNALIEDETGSMKLTLWGNQIDKVKKGDKIRIKGGYVREFNGELFLNVGRNGTLERL